jgi:hypothetical protein
MFENGTSVEAQDYSRAIELLRSISLKNIIEFEHDGENNWVIKFHPRVSIQTRAPDHMKALRAAEWLTYLDRRDPKLV